MKNSTDKRGGSDRIVNDTYLNILIAGLEDSYTRGIRNPWRLSNGTVIQPLNLLYELRAFRRAVRKMGDP